MIWVPLSTCFRNRSPNSRILQAAEEADRRGLDLFDARPPKVRRSVRAMGAQAVSG
jgi:hypothetical protein